MVVKISTNLLLLRKMLFICSDTYQASENTADPLRRSRHSSFTYSLKNYFGSTCESWLSSLAYLLMCLHSNTKEATSAHLSYSVTTWMLCDTEHTLIVRLKIFRNNFATLL